MQNKLITYLSLPLIILCAHCIYDVGPKEDIVFPDLPVPDCSSGGSGGSGNETSTVSQTTSTTNLSFLCKLSDGTVEKELCCNNTEIPDFPTSCPWDLIPCGPCGFFNIHVTRCVCPDSQCFSREFGCIPSGEP